MSLTIVNPVNYIPVDVIVRDIKEQYDDSFLIGLACNYLKVFDQDTNSWALIKKRREKNMDRVYKYQA